MAKTGYVYILASKPHGTLYVGVTNNLLRRVYEHSVGNKKCFTSKYGVHRLVYVERYDDIQEAIWREKKLKRWTRKKKIALILAENPTWRDLTEDEL
ncbi:MAG: GIY-YIG nuclease family protein [Rhodothermales bacterium]